MGELERFGMAVRVLRNQVIKMLIHPIAALLIRRITSVVRLATKLVGLIPERESRRDDDTS